MNLTPGTNQAQRDAIDRVLGKKITFGNFLPMMEIPRVSADDESFSETVIVYSESLDDHDFGYYDFKDNSWYSPNRG